MNPAPVDLTGRVAVVTGGGKGIGRAIAEGLAARGAAVVVNNRCRDGHDPASEVVEAITRAGGTAVADDTVVGAEGSGERLVAHARAAFGGLDLVVSNAAVVDRALFARSDPDRFRQVLDIDFWGAVDLTRAALDDIVERRGRILYVTSSAGLYGEAGVASYAAAKGALIAFARSLAAEVARHGVRVNLLAPFAATAMTAGHVPPGLEDRLAPEFVVPAALWLLGDDVPLNGAVVVAAANRFRLALTGETTGLRFDGDTPVAPERLAAHVDELTAPDGWRPFADATSAFLDLVGLAPPSTP
ncbi:MAG: SDR family NAD(P)-dependent oxidoreductase [Actinomyces sp.]|nr:MAG: SDR family NAD(P)-dependent oxidoreductase [Actinomyces sp.]